MQPLKNELARSDDVLFVLYDFETTQDTKFSENATQLIPILVCIQQFCLVCEMQEDIETDCDRCGRRRHSCYDDPVGDLLSHLCEPRPWCNKVEAIAHNAKAFDSQFILKRAFLLKWNPQLILTGLKIISMKMQHIHFLDSISYLPLPLRKLPEAFGLSAKKMFSPTIGIQRQIWIMWAPYPTLSISVLTNCVRERERISFPGIKNIKT